MLNHGAKDLEIFHPTVRKLQGKEINNVFGVSKITFFFQIRVWNISKIKVNEKYSFPTTDDHSKWGVSDDQSDWICVGDINRAVSSIGFVKKFLKNLLLFN